ncbi:hypothetical protein [Lactococcus lactis]|uniref:hypothetical protein n=1 Tax=Lactococcus lactis TaxID=1358 RepID=UPI0022E055E2|nr:hypothetical protein [Lactococcus lactis]
MKNKYNQYHLFQLDNSNTIQKTSHGNLMLKYESKNIMDKLFEGFKHHNYDIPSYVSQFMILPNDDKSGEQMFNFKIYDEDGFQMGSRNVKESFLLYLSPSNQLVDATLTRDADLKESLKEYGGFYMLEEIEDDYLFEMSINNNVDNELGIIDIYPEDNGSYALEKDRARFYVSELHEIEKLFSIFYGSVFSIKFERVFVKWVRYEVTIPRIKVADLSELKETVRTLKYLLEKVDKQVNLD